MAARDEDFLGGGTIDPFTGLAPAMTPEEEATQRLMKLRYAAQQTANSNVGFQRSQQHGDTSPTTPQERADYDAYARRNHLGEYAYGLGHNLANDPLTMGILAAPALVTGAGAAIGGASALGIGAGTGSIATPAGEAAVVGANAAPAMGTPFTMASPFPAAGATGGAAGAAGAAGKFGAAEFAKSIGVPVLSALAPLAINQMTSGKTKEQKALLELQKQMAHEAQVRQGQLQDQRMNALGQQVLAFNPRNQMMAQIYGPQAAFTPEQAAQMVQGQEPPMDPAIMNYAGNDQTILHQKQEMMRRHAEWQKAEAQRREMIMNGFQAPGPGPAPINMPAPQAARRF